MQSCTQTELEPDASADRRGYALCLVRRDQLDAALPLVDGLLERAIAQYGRGYLPDVVSRLRCGLAQLWLITAPSNGMPVAAVVTYISDDADIGPEFFIEYIAGDNMDRWLDLLEKLEDNAREEGCKSIALCGRRGWQRALARRGYSELAVVLGKQL